MKVLVETMGEYSLYNHDGSTIHRKRPSVTLSTVFVNQNAGLGRLRVIHNDLPESASDEEFAKFWKESNGDQELAIESFMSSLQPEPEGEDEGEEKPARRTTRRKK